jgi:ABC-type dipeptide/oligopeptide/nickel transport system permease subunit
MVAVGLSAIPFYVRPVRGTTLAVTAEAHIEAARALGGGDRRIALWHVLPNISGPLMVFISIVSAPMMWSCLMRWLPVREGIGSHAGAVLGWRRLTRWHDSA